MKSNALVKLAKSAVIVDIVEGKPEFAKDSLTYAKLANLAYKQPSEISHKLLIDPNMNLVGFIHDRAYGTFAYIATCKANREVFVVWRGTNEKKDWISNFKVSQRKFQGFPGKVHHGFFDAIPFSHVDDMISPYLVGGNYKLINIGHSLGGALATLYSYHAKINFNHKTYKVDAVTFGAPKVGNKAFVEEYNKIVKCTRFVHGHDIVAHLPWLFGLFYKHVGECVFIDDGKIYLNPPIKFNIWNFIVALWTIKSLVNDHFMDAYIKDLLFLIE